MVRAGRAEGLRLLSDPSVSVLIREARSEDGEAIAGLLAELDYPVGTDVVQARLQRLLADGASWVWVAELDRRPVGLAALHVIALLERPALARLTAIVVAGDSRRGGVGRALLAEVERRARGEGCERLEVSTADRRADAHAFYRRLEFTESARRFVKPLRREPGWGDFRQPC